MHPSRSAFALGARLLNSAGIELWPAPLLRARASADARILARAHTVLRRKRDGRYLAAVLDQAEYAGRSGLALVAEPQWLALAGFDRWRRPLWLRPGAARAWRAMQRAAALDGVALDAISGYRSHDYQLGIFERKLARGQSVAQILQVNAAPGFSEHHGGDALDIGTPGDRPAEESFEATAAFAWLGEYAGRHGFGLSYPRGNPHGIVYEPWHWRFHAAP